MARYKINIEYDGTPFHGWQRQKGYDTVQERVEECALPFLKQRIVLHGSGRTDAGVHAICQVAHFDFENEIDCYRLQECMNFYLADVPIGILSIEKVSDKFNARLHAQERSYLYKIINRRTKLCLNYNRAWHIPVILDSEKMHAAAQCLVGKHDFSSFRAAGCQAKSPVKTLNSISVTKNGDVITVLISAKSFLYHQVRNIVGSLVLIGSGKWQTDDLVAVLNARDRTKAGQTAPACGLYFLETKYNTLA